MPNSKEESKRCLTNTMDVDEDDGSEEQSGGDDESKKLRAVGSTVWYWRLPHCRTCHWRHECPGDPSVLSCGD